MDTLPHYLLFYIVNNNNLRDKDKTNIIKTNKKLYEFISYVEWNEEHKTTIVKRDNGTFRRLVNTKESPHFPPDVKYIRFYDSFNEELLPGSLHPGIIGITFGRHYNKKIDAGVLPQGLTHLTFGRLFKRRLEELVLPPGLTYLALCSGYKQHINRETLPVGLTHLIFCVPSYDTEQYKNIPRGPTNLTFCCNYPQNIGFYTYLLEPL